ncbi:hypothetical protein Q6249_28530, partial [Klebsiella pneumoniae]|uniref:hypothetical protein n=1 Tax=Klebsiella pneumoniae TaxID=573 RepID=UPI00272EF171
VFIMALMVVPLSVVNPRQGRVLSMPLVWLLNTITRILMRMMGIRTDMASELLMVPSLLYWLAPAIEHAVCQAGQQSRQDQRFIARG